jgi:hypothetical protein
LARSKCCRGRKPRGIFHFKSLIMIVSIRLGFRWTKWKSHIPLVDAKKLGRSDNLAWPAIFRPFTIPLASRWSFRDSTGLPLYVASIPFPSFALSRPMWTSSLLSVERMFFLGPHHFLKWFLYWCSLWPFR